MMHDELIGNVLKSYMPKTVLKKLKRVNKIEVHDLKGNLKAVFTKTEEQQ